VCDIYGTKELSVLLDWNIGMLNKQGSHDLLQNILKVTLNINKPTINYDTHLWYTYVIVTAITISTDNIMG
jgi:hypothetical protein